MPIIGSKPAPYIAVRTLMLLMRSVMISNQTAPNQCTDMKQ